MTRIALRPLPILLLSMACSVGGEDSGLSAGSGLTGGSASATTTDGGSDTDATSTGAAATTDASTTGTTTGAAEDTGEVKFDTPDGMTAGADDGGTMQGCEKVDFLFVIDNSGSMDDDQQNLIANFPGFMDAIEQTLEVEDFHVMVVDTDAGGNTNPGCYDWWEQQGDPWHITPCPLPPQQSGTPPAMETLIEECDYTMGAGVDMPHGFDASNMECNFTSGTRYMDKTEPDLAAAFSCAAQVGTGGNNGERPAESLMSAVAPAINGAGGCNAGFLREDALLVVTILTDEDDVFSDPKEPADWAQALIDAKSGKEENIVVLGLLSEWATKLSTMASMFTHGQVESVLLTDYQPFFESAVIDIDGACDTFVPPG